MDKPILVLIAGLSFVALAPSCGGQASTICGLECDCEHCSDVKEDLVCAQRERDSDVADAYGCESEWNAWATCFENRGECDEKEARYSTIDTNAPGSCSGETDLGVACPGGNADCATAGANAYCSGGSCKSRTCLGTGIFCTSNDQCSSGGGKDRCDNEASALAKCEAAASAHKQEIQPPAG